MPDGRRVSRRRFLQAGAVGATVAAASTLPGHAERVLDRAFRPDPMGAGSLADIDHFVLLMQENRSFDHYFGSMSGVRGFDEGGTAMLQRRAWNTGGGFLRPFRLDTTAGDPFDAAIVNDPDHDWDIQHAVWNGGAMDRWMIEHGACDGPAAQMVMGYYERADIPVHYALADAFTVCDNYYSSVMGPTGPNRLYWMTATLGAHQSEVEPVLGHLGRRPPGSLPWRTFPENLQDAGVSWKIYNHPAHHRSELTGMVKYFPPYQDPGSELHRRGIRPRYPDDFRFDVATNSLPAVSWIVPSMSASEHPAHPSAVGAAGIVEVLDVLSSNPELWERTALIVSYDENGGFFDHVAPPTPPARAADEHVVRRGVSMPVGLGFRVPCLVLSPYTRGGLVSSSVYDHTSQLQLLGARFGVPVPNLTPWRAGVTGDMTDLFPARPAVTGLPTLPDTASAARAAVDGRRGLIRAAIRQQRPAYPVPLDRVPRQAQLPVRPRV